MDSGPGDRGPSWRPITNQEGVVVLDATAVVWRDPVVAAAVRPAA
jgi:hypothetical protein